MRPERLADNKMLIHTTKGLVNRNLLTVTDVVTEEDNARILATEWFMGDELVRRDVNVNVLRGLELNSKQEIM